MKSITLICLIINFLAVSCASNKPKMNLSKVENIKEDIRKCGNLIDIHSEDPSLGRDSWENDPEIFGVLKNDDTELFLKYNRSIDSIRKIKLQSQFLRFSRSGVGCAYGNLTQEKENKIFFVNEFRHY